MKKQTQMIPKEKKQKDKKQTIKIAISIFAIVLSCCLIVGTMFIAKNSTGNAQQMQPPGQSQSSDSGNPPELPQHKRQQLSNRQLKRQQTINRKERLVIFEQQLADTTVKTRRRL